jgi:hypothetical protein
VGEESHRLVEQHDLWIHARGACDGDAPLLPAGKLETGYRAQVSNFEQFDAAARLNMTPSAPLLSHCSLGTIAWPAPVWTYFLRRRRLPMNPFSCTIDIKRFQNLLETSVNETERRRIQKLLAYEKAKPALQAPD